MSLPADTTGRSLIDWQTSPEYRAALDAWAFASYADLVAGVEFESSQPYRNARHAYRKRVNHSWDKEST